MHIVPAESYKSKKLILVFNYISEQQTTNRLGFQAWLPTFLFQTQNIQPLTKIENLQQFYRSIMSAYYLVLPLIFLCTQLVSSLHCSSSCTYDYNQSISNYEVKCTASSNANACTACDPLFYKLSGTSCSLSPRGIFNTTITFATADWGNLTNMATVNIDSSNAWLEFQDTSRTNAYKTITTAHYGIQCRALFHIESSVTFMPSINFGVNNSFEAVSMIPQLDSAYPFEQWIFTSQFFHHTSTNVMLSLSRDDGVANPPSALIAFKDVRCLVAYCVTNCASCTDLYSCIRCNTGYILDFKTRQCMSTCPRGQYNTSTDFCDACDDLCLTCTTSSTYCTSCENYGTNQAFLFNNVCYRQCPNGTFQNYDTHLCDCPLNRYMNSTANYCYQCFAGCKKCSGPSANECTQCNIGYFEANITNSTVSNSCVLACPSGQYASLIYDLATCYSCNANCAQCENSATQCTACSGGSWLYNRTCLTRCPDGYEGNNSTLVCVVCAIGKYSWQNVCYSECPIYYIPNEQSKTCTLHQGYPLNVSFEVYDKDTLKFTIPFLLGIKSSLVTMLNSSWQTYISLYYSSNADNLHIVNYNQRLLTSYDKMDITNATVSSTAIILYSTSLSAADLIYANQFKVRFLDNLLSPRDVVYVITTANTTSSAPWVVREYFDLNLKLLYLVGTLMMAAAVVLLLARVRFVYRVLMQYLHSMQLIGLTLYAMYPSVVSLDLYSFVLGFDFANFTFMYNLSQRYISSCQDCSSFASFSFINGDMNWLRMMGSLLASFVLMLLVCMILHIFKFSRDYSMYFLVIVADLVIVKSIHGWFASLVYSGLNLGRSESIVDFYQLSTHAISYLVLIPILFIKFKVQKQNKFTNISLLFTAVSVILLTVVSLAPILICSLMILCSCLELSYVSAQNLAEENRIMSEHEIDLADESPSRLINRFHNQLIRLMKPICSFLAACVLMIDSSNNTIIIVSVIMGVLLILVVLDAYLHAKYFTLGMEANKVDNIEASSESDANIVKKSINEKDMNGHAIVFDDTVMDVPVSSKKKAGEQIKREPTIYGGALNDSQFYRTGGLKHYETSAKANLKDSRMYDDRMHESRVTDKDYQNRFNDIEQKIKAEVTKLRNKSGVSNY